MDREENVVELDGDDALGKPLLVLCLNRFERVQTYVEQGVQDESEQIERKEVEVQPNDAETETPTE